MLAETDITGESVEHLKYIEETSLSGTSTTTSIGVAASSAYQKTSSQLSKTMVATSSTNEAHFESTSMSSTETMLTSSVVTEDMESVSESM